MSLLPSCPICLREYTTDNNPLIFSPCGHGVCTSCYAKCVERNIADVCGLCRMPVADAIVNYDLRSICRDSDKTWKDTLRSSLANVKNLVGHEFTIDDSLHTIAPLLTLKAENIQSIFRFNRVLAQLVVEMPIPMIEQWIIALQFGNERTLLQAVRSIAKDKLFLESKSALWVLKMVH